MTQVKKMSVVPRAARFERPRPRLLGLLAQALDVSLIVLAAPSGYGKTTLLAQYARSTPRRVAWCRLNGSHEGPGDVVTRLAGHLPELSALQQLDARTPGEVLARRLADELAALDQGTDLIVDNLEDEQLACWLGSLADRLEEGHRLLLSCYTPEGLRLAHRLANDSALVLDSGDLAFDEAEVQAYLTGREASLGAAQLSSLSGWPAGLALSAHGVNRHAGADDLVLEALQGLPPVLRAGLPLLAPLEFWSEADAALLSPGLPTHWLSTLLKAGLPLSPLGSGVFQPHQLLVGVLERLLQRDPEQARVARAAAARLAEASGELERAARLYLQAGEAAEALRLAESLVSRYRDRGEHRLTRALLEALSGVSLSVVLQERLAWAQIETGSSQEGEASLQALREADLLTPAGFACLATVRGRQGLFSEQLALAQEGLARVGDGPLVPALAWPLVFASLRLGRHAQAEGAAAQLVALAESGGDQVRLAEAWQLQGIAWQHTRPAGEAIRPLVRARAIYEQLGWHGRAADLNLDELELLVRDGEIQGVAQRLRQLVSVVGAERAVFHARRLRLLGAVERREGRPQQAEAALLEALDTTRTGGLELEQSRLNLEWADFLLQQGRTAEAAPWLSAVGLAALEPRRAVLNALMSGQSLRLTQAEVDGEPDAETRLRASLLLAAQGAAEAWTAAQAEISRNRHALSLPTDRALRVRLAGTPAEAALETLLVAGPVPEPSGERLLLLDVVTLGDLQVRLDGRPVHIGLTKARELLVWLALHGSGSRDELVTALWDGSGEERHAEYFRVAVRRLRGALKGFVPVDLDPLPYASGRYRLAPAFQVEVDVLSPVNPGWTRPFLPGVDTEWAQQFRAQALQQALASLLEQALSAPAGQAPELFRQLLAADPMFAPAHEGLIRAFAQVGDPGSARQALRSYGQMLKTEYGAPLPAPFLESLPPDLPG